MDVRTVLRSDAVERLERQNDPRALGLSVPNDVQS